MRVVTSALLVVTRTLLETTNKLADCFPFCVLVTSKALVTTLQPISFTLCV